MYTHIQRVCIYMSALVYTEMYMCVCVYVCVCIYTHTHIHLYEQIWQNINNQWLWIKSIQGLYVSFLKFLCEI